MTHSTHSQDTSVVRCSCCDNPIEWDDRIDVDHDPPDALLDLPNDSIRRHARGLVRAKGVGHFVRCLLPITLSGDVSLVAGVWIKVSKADYKQCLRAWDKPSYADLVLGGTLATVFGP